MAHHNEIPSQENRASFHWKPCKVDIWRSAQRRFSENDTALHQFDSGSSIYSQWESVRELESTSFHPLAEFPSFNMTLVWGFNKKRNHDDDSLGGYPCESQGLLSISSTFSIFPGES